MPGDLISSVRTFLFQYSTIYTIFYFKCISAQQIKGNTFNFQLNSYVRMKYTACFADIHRKRRCDEIKSPYVTAWETITLLITTHTALCQQHSFDKPHILDNQSGCKDK